MSVIENGTIIIYEVFIRHGLTLKYYGNSSTKYSLVAIEFYRWMFHIVKTIWAQNIAQTSMIDRSICTTFLDNNCIITDDRYNSKV